MTDLLFDFFWFCLSKHCFDLVRFELSLFMTNQSVKLMCVDVW